MQLPFVSAGQVHAALDYKLLAEALRAAFREGCTVPLRHVHDVTGEGDRLLLMPAWRPGKDLGVKLVTVFPRNRARGAATVVAPALECVARVEVAGSEWDVRASSAALRQQAALALVGAWSGPRTQRR